NNHLAPRNEFPGRKQIDSVPSPLLYAGAAEISSSKAIIMLYFSGRVCYDLAGIRPVTTEISFEALKKMPFPHDMEGSENLSLR
ncbi:MAG: hypothetical protein KH842_07810, partial [Firmicutes bacterium]|nr:hypothetical protein [Bacillota bacterium]